MAAAAEQAVVGSQDESGAVQALLARLYDAWARGDADAYAALFSEDADYVVFDGTHLKGREQIAESHRPLFTRFLKGTRLVGETPEIRFLSPTVALIHSRGGVVKAGQQRAGRGSLSVQTLVAVKQGAWQLTAFQNTRYRPFDKTLLGRLFKLFGGPSTSAPSVEKGAQ
jgi:uncharacterized protein (TIGR02246 family)